MTPAPSKMETVTVAEVMTNLAVTVRPEHTLHEAARRLVDNRITGAPVVRRGRVVGVVSEADIVRSCAPPRRRGVRSPSDNPLALLLFGDCKRGVDAVAVGDVMSTDVISVSPEADVGTAALLIDRHGVRRLPVIDDDGYLAGVVTRSDLIRAMVRTHENTKAGRRPKAPIRVIEGDAG